MAKGQKVEPRTTREGLKRIRDELWRLALCDHGDAIRLMLSAQPGELDFGLLDLRCVQSIRRVKDGLEVEFVNRVEILRYLHELYAQAAGMSARNREVALVKALLAGAQAVDKTDGGELD